MNRPSENDPSSPATPPTPSSDDDSSTDGSAASLAPPPRPRSASLSGGDVRAPSPSMATRRSGTPTTSSPRRSLSFDETGVVNVNVATVRPSSRPRSNPRRQHTPTEGGGHRGRYESPLSPLPNRYNIHQLDGDRQDVAALDADERLAREIARRVALADATRRSPGAAAPTTSTGGGRALTAGYATGEATAAATLHERLHRQRQRRQEQELAPIGGAPRRSDKQSRPSRRKMRRWDNDAMVGVAAEIARGGSSKGGDAARGARMAEAFARGEADAVHFLKANHPREYRSVFASMVDDGRDDNSKMAQVKDRFVRGEVSAPTSVDPARDRQRRTRKGWRDAFSDGPAMFRRIEPRLRKILLRTCGADGGIGTTGRVVRLLDAFEVYLISKFRSGGVSKVSAASGDGEAEEGGFVVVSAEGEEKGKEGPENIKVEREAMSVLGGILLEPPTVQLPPEVAAATTGVGGSTVLANMRAPSADKNSNKKGGSGGTQGVQFLFDPTSSQGGFHRLLLHAVCQFHGLQATSTSTSGREVSAEALEKGGEIDTPKHLTTARTRALLVTGSFRGAKFRLVDFASAAARRGTESSRRPLPSSGNEPPGRCHEKSPSAANESLVGASSVGCIAESIASMRVS